MKSKIRTCTLLLALPLLLAMPKLDAAEIDDAKGINFAEVAFPLVAQLAELRVAVPVAALVPSSGLAGMLGAEFWSGPEGWLSNSAFLSATIPEGGEKPPSKRGSASASFPA